MSDQFELPGDFRAASIYIKSTIMQAGPSPRAGYMPPPLPTLDELPDPGPVPPGSHVPFSRNAVFTGREETLKALARMLLQLAGGAQSEATATVALQGTAGVGKTQLAVEFCYRYGRYFRGVHWLNAAEPAGISAEVAACGVGMALPSWPENQPEQVERTIAEWQASGPQLVVLDNLEDVNSARDWLTRLAMGGMVRVLLTARRTDWPEDLGLAALAVRVFSLEESCSFLRQHLSAERANDESLWRLAERLGRLPLALELAGRYLTRMPRLTVAGYVERLTTVLADPAMQHWRADLGSPTGHDLDLAATFSVSWQQVRDKAAQQVFAVAGWCAPDNPIPCELLERATGLDQEECDRAIEVLAGLGLLEWDRPWLGTGPQISPLLAEFGRTVASPDGKDDGPLMALARALVALTRQVIETGLPARFVPLRAHVEMVAGHATTAKLKIAGMLWDNVGYHRRMVADYAGARAAFEHALLIDEQVYGPEHPKVATDVNAIGLVLKNLGDLAGARAAYERALHIDEVSLGGEHASVARDINNLGGALKDMGDLPGALAAYERALHIGERVHGLEHPQVAVYVNNLGNVLHLLGDLAGARAAIERALRIDEAAFGVEHPKVARDMNNLGGLLHDLGDVPGARAAFEQALRIDEKAFGPEHPTVAIRVLNLGRALKDLGDLAGARAAFERALRIDEAAFGPEHPSVASDMNNLGVVLQNLGDLAGARAAFNRVVRINEQVYGPNSAGVATSVSNLGRVLQDLGDLDEARAAFERALRIAEEVLGPEHPEVARDVNNLGGVLYALGDLPGARAAFERALRVDEAAFGSEHREIATDVNNLGSVLQAQGDLAGARAAFEWALRIDAATVGPEHLEAAVHVNNLGNVLRSIGDLAGARAAFERALAILVRFLPPDHPHIRIAQGNLENLG